MLDERFQGVFKDKDLALDPTHKEYNKEKMGELINEKLRRKKLKTN